MNFRFSKYFYLLGLAFFACATPSSNVVRIAAASNMQFALQKLTKIFEAKTSIKTQLIIASSGKHTAQIMEGAPFDVFLSADMAYPESIYKKGLSSSAPKVYAQGQLVLWAGKKNDELSLNTLLDTDINHIAIANPKTAPYGIAASQILDSYDLISSVKNKLVFGESISQVNQFISTGAVQLGFTVKSVVMANKLNFEGSWIDLPKETYEPVNQGIVLLDKKNGKNQNALEFYNFLFSNEAQQVLKDFGYLGIDN